MIGFRMKNDKVVFSIYVFFDFFGIARNGMIGFRTKNDKVVFSIDVFSTFLGQPAAE